MNLDAYNVQVQVWYQISFYVELSFWYIQVQRKTILKYSS